MIKEPKNELEVIIWFVEDNWCNDFGFKVLSATSSAFPDAVLIDNDGKHYRTEFEFYASSFIEHEHNPYECDLIVCWKNDFPIDTLFPIWELSSNTFPKIWNANNDDRESILEHIENVMQKRASRRNEKSSIDWRKSRNAFSEDQIMFISSNGPKDVVKYLSEFGFEITPRTASNWKIYATEELGSRYDK